MLEIETESELEEDENDETIPHSGRPLSRSFVWGYFNKVPGNPNSKICRLCNLTFANKSANLGRHLQTVHNIKGRTQKSRRTSSFIWKYCIRINDKQALCRLCNKLFYFGGGNTTNMTKHLQRKHAESIDYLAPKLPKKIRKTTSYVWDYVTKLPNNLVLCTICQSEMTFHGTANLMKHLDIHKIAGEKRSSHDRAKSSDPIPSPFDYCVVPQNEHLKCNMSDTRFEPTVYGNEEMAAHMKASNKMEKPPLTAKMNSIDENDENGKEIGIRKEDIVQEEQDQHSIIDQQDDEALYYALIEEDIDGNENLTTLDSEAITSTIENQPPTAFTHNLEEPDQDDEEDLITIAESETSSRMLQLKEELLRQQTNYFNEKAGYYRMQKYLVGLQVKRERLEIEMLRKSQSNTSMT